MTTPAEHKLFKPVQWQEITRRAIAAWNSGAVTFENAEVLKMGIICKATGGSKLFHNWKRPQLFLQHEEVLPRFFKSQGGEVARVDARTWIEETTPEISSNPVFAAIDQEAIAGRVNVIEIGIFLGYKGVFVRTSSYGHMRVCNKEAYVLWRAEREAKQRLTHIKNRAGEKREVPQKGDDNVRTVLRENKQRAHEYVRSDRMVRA
jgi:hypothetical protein